MDKYDIFIIGGQSNAEGFGRGTVTEEYIPDERIMSLSVVHTATWNCETNRTDFDYPGLPYELEIARERTENGVVLGEFPLTFAKAYVDAGLLAEGRKVLLVRGAVGDTGFNFGDWKPTGFARNEMFKLLRYAIRLNPTENCIKAFLWHQGEHDGIWQYPPEQYRKDVHGLIADVKDLCGDKNLPFICGGFCADWAEKEPEKSERIEAELRKLGTQYNGFVETHDLQSNRERTGDEDWIHFCREAQHILGRRYFDFYRKTL